MAVSTMPPKTKAASRKGKKTKNDGIEERISEERERQAAEQEREGERAERGEEKCFVARAFANILEPDQMSSYFYDN